MKVVAGTSSPLLAKRVADELKTKLAKTTFKQFPDGELYVRVESCDEAIVVQSITSSDDIVSLMLLFDALENNTITAVIPYMGYARQDRRFYDGEAISIRAVARLIEGYADRVISVNIHSREAASYFRKLEEVDAMGLIGEYYKGRDVVMVSPDFGSFERVKRAAKAAGCEFDYLEKRRIDAEHVEIVPKRIDLEGRNVVIVDDIISTGGTVIEAAKLLKARVEAACVHAVLASNALNKLYAAGVSRVVATDTIERAVSSISVAKLITKAVKA